MKKIMVGVDIGTSGTKTILVDDAGRVIAANTVEYPLITPRPGWAEQDPADWWNAVKASISAVMKSSGVAPDSLAGLGLSGQMHGMVALDSLMNVVRPAILWCDGRTQRECEEITEAAGGLSGLLSQTNNQMLPGYTGGKILWMKRHEPQNFDRTTVICNPKDYIRYLLTGEMATEVSDASGTGLFDVENRRFNLGLIEKLGIPREWFPKCYESSDVIGRITANVARETGLPEGLPVVGGGGDAVIQTTGAGLVSPGVLGVVLGTSGVVAMGLDGFKRNAGALQVFCNNAPNLWHAMGVTLAAGGSYRWWRDALCPLEVKTAQAEGVSPYDVMGRIAEKSPPGAKRLLFLPYLTGERCPYSDPDARGAFVGLHFGHDRGDMTRCVMEGVTFSIKQVANLIFGMDSAMKPDRIVASGGGALSPLWRQILADICRMPVVTVSGAAEGGAYGAALVAGVGCGVYGNISQAVSVLKNETLTEPLQQNFGVYGELEAIYSSLYAALKPAMHGLAKDNA